MNKILMRLCAAALSFSCFCSSGVFAMFSVGGEIPFPPAPLHYNKKLYKFGYPYVIEATDVSGIKEDADIKKLWDKFWWCRRDLERDRIRFGRYIQISRTYPLTAEIQIRRRNTENGRSEKWERVNRALKSSADWVFHEFLADYFYNFYKKDCRKRFTPECLWSILKEVNSSFVRKIISEKTGKELSEDEDLCEEFKKVPIEEKDINDCLLSSQGLPTPIGNYTANILNAVQFIGEGLYYLKFDHLVVFFSTLYAYFFDNRTKYYPEQIYIIYECIEKLYFWLVTDVLEEHKRERPGWFTAAQYGQFLQLKKGCDPDSYEFRSEASGVMSRLKNLGL
ncbi:MAG: hypothetical protein Q4D57_00175 [Clostridia bacterium]|nr:hypothetical protein [Clostridia bacterium]